MCELYDDIRNHTGLPLPDALTHDRRHITYKQLAEVLQSDIIFQPLEPGSELYDASIDLPQYEMVTYNPNTNYARHYTLKTTSSESALNITYLLQSYFETGSIVERSLSDTAPHLIPLPTFPLVVRGGNFVPCVKLKTGQKALIANDQVILGVDLPS